MYLLSAKLLEVSNIAANGHDLKRKIINMNFSHLLEISDKNTFNSPPENVNDHAMLVTRLLINGYFHKAFENTASLDIWKFVKNRDSVLEMPKDKIK